jgi:PKD repeat protein
VEAPGSQTPFWWRTGLIAALSATAVLLWLGAAPAHAIVLSVGGQTYGLTPIRGVMPQASATSHRLIQRSGTARSFDGPPEGGGPLVYNGGPVLHTVVSHVIYWDPGGEFTAATKSVIGKFFTDVGADSGKPSNVFAVGGQYSDGAGRALYSASFSGALVDKEAYPATGNCSIPKAGDQGPPYTKCLFDSQVKEGLKEFITKENLSIGSSAQYFVLFPHKVVTCFNQTEEEIEKFGQICSNNFFCAYHSSINGGAPKEIIYSDIPFSLLDTGNVKSCQDDGNEALLQHPNGDISGTNATTRFADVALKYTSHEYIEASTDPLGTAYFDTNGQEIGDKCNGVHGNGSGVGYDPNSFLPTLGGKASEENLFNQSINADHYYIQSEWDNAAKACTMQPVPMSGVGFTHEPASGLVGSPISFKGAAVDLYPGLSVVWKWGDGTESPGLSPSHTYAAVGKYVVTMTAKDEFVFLAPPPVTQTVEVSKASQTIGFTSSSPSPANVGASYEVAAEASSKLAVALTIDGSSGSACSMAGSKVEFKAIGTCTIDANQAGNATYNAAPQVQQVITVKNGQAISFTSVAPGSAVVGGPTYEVNAEAKPSGLPVALTIDASSSTVCTIAGSIVSFVGGGTCTIDANQAGNPSYNAAPQVQQSLAVARLSQTIIFTSAAPASAISGGSTYAASATSSSGLPVALTIDASTTSVCTIAGSTVSFTGPGRCTLDANQGGNAGYNPASQVQQSFAVAAPVMLTPALHGGLGPEPTPPNGSFLQGAISFDANMGTVSLSETVSDPGTLSWLLTFQNGKFGVFASSAKCKVGSVRLGGKCRPSKIVFARGTRLVAAPSTIRLRLKPSTSALKALRNTLKQKKGLPVTATFTFQSSLGGPLVSHTQTLLVKLKKR